jgi:arsenate reductase
MAEYLLRARGAGRFESYSAGTFPVGQVNPFAIEVLAEHFRIDASGARSKSWDEYRDVKFDFVITICDRAKGSCPIWPGQPVGGHWASPDPITYEGDPERTRRHFLDVATQINSRIGLFCSFRDEQLDSWHVHSVGEEFRFPASPEAKD